MQGRRFVKPGGLFVKRGRSYIMTSVREIGGCPEVSYIRAPVREAVGLLHNKLCSVPKTSHLFHKQRSLCKSPPVSQTGPLFHEQGPLHKKPIRFKNRACYVKTLLFHKQATYFTNSGHDVRAPPFHKQAPWFDEPGPLHKIPPVPKTELVM